METAAVATTEASKGASKPEAVPHDGGPASAEEALQLHVFQTMTGAFTTNMMWLGERLGLYRALADIAEPATPADIATRLGLNARYVAEWCRQQASAKIISCDCAPKQEKFWLNEAQKDVLVREGADGGGSPYFSLGMLEGLPDLGAVAFSKLPELFKSGGGLTYDDYGPGVACGVCRELAVWQRHFLADLLRGLPKIGPKLEAGCAVADVGCGCGESVLTAAAAFPASSFTGYDTSEIALNEARRRLKASGLKNADFQNPGPDGAGMPSTAFDLAITNDAIHDMAQPFEVLAAVRRCLKDGGAYVMGDMKAGRSHGESIAANPMAPLLYGFSCHLCLPSAMVGDGAAGLGTLGLTEDLAREKMMEAGFTALEVLPWEHPLNRYYLATTAGTAAEE